MKIKLTIIFAFLLASCRPSETPESVAEKYLCDLRSDLSELGFWNAAEHDNRSLALMLNEQADSILSGGKIPTMLELFDKYFQDNKVFSSWELIDVAEQAIDLYRIGDFTVEGGNIEHDAILDIYKKEGSEYNGEKLCKITETAAVILEHKNIPMYLIRYKIDSRHVDFVGDEYRVATVGVIKHPEGGYEVVSFVWNK